MSVYRIRWDGGSNTVSTVGNVPIKKGTYVFAHAGSPALVRFWYAYGAK